MYYTSVTYFERLLACRRRQRHACHTSDVDYLSRRQVHDFLQGWKEGPIGDVVSGTLGYLGVDVKNSQVTRANTSSAVGVARSFSEEARSVGMRRATIGDRGSIVWSN